MFVGDFTERPYQDQKSGYFGAAGRNITDLGLSNGSYDPKLGADLYNRYLDEKVYAEEMGFEASARWVREHRDRYARAIFHGFRVEDDR